MALPSRLGRLHLDRSLNGPQSVAGNGNWSTTLFRISLFSTYADADQEFEANWT